MEHLQSFLEHQKRKFKSLQKEKQKERDEKEAEERRKSWGSSYSYGWSYGDDWYDDWYPQSTSNVSSTTTTVNQAPTGSTVSTNRVFLLTQEDRRRSPVINVKKRTIYEEALMDLFPKVDLRNLPEGCVVKPRDNLYRIEKNKDYDVYVSSSTPQNKINIKNNINNEVTWPMGYFRLYKKYNFGDVFIIPKDIYGDTAMFIKGNNLTMRKMYKVVGESEEEYEITNDKGQRMGLPKIWFNLPFKVVNGRKVTSKTEAQGGLHDYD